MPEPTEQHRRLEDQPQTTMAKVKDRTLVTVVLMGSIGFLYQLSEILLRHQDWMHFRTPAGVGEVLFALVCGLGAVAAAIGLDVQSLLRGFKRTD
jgi:hypothetical protein